MKMTKDNERGKPEELFPEHKKDCLTFDFYQNKYFSPFEELVGIVGWEVMKILDLSVLVGKVQSYYDGNYYRLYQCIPNRAQLHSSKRFATRPKNSDRELQSIFKVRVLRSSLKSWNTGTKVLSIHEVRVWIQGSLLAGFKAEEFQFTVQMF